MAISDEDFNHLLRRLGIKEDADVNFIRRFRELMERLYPDGEPFSKDDFLKAQIAAYIVDGDYPPKPERLLAQ